MEENKSPVLLDQPKSCPWGGLMASPAVTPCSFANVMDEEFAGQVQKEEELKYAPVVEECTSNANVEVSRSSQAESSIEGLQTSDTANDLLLAEMLQLEFDRENDEFVKAQEKHANTHSQKVTMTYKNFLVTHPYDIEEGSTEQHDLDESDEEDENIFWANQFEDVRHNTKMKGEIITKHDPIINKKRNAQNVERFPPSFKSGNTEDLGGFSNKVFNQLKQHSIREEKISQRVHEKKEHSSYEKALDENARLRLYKLVNNGTLESIDGVVSTGKEAVVIHAKGGESDNGPLPKECAIKVFKTTLNEFKTREKYIRDDHRFKDRLQKNNPRVLIKMWAEKEFRNLKRLYDAGVRCPEPIALKGQILLMSFIGTDNTAAPKLKDVRMATKQYRQAYEDIIESMRQMYQDCNLIHADMSEYNILWHDDHAWIIDVSQSIEPTHEHAYNFLARDIQNVCDYFSSVGLVDIMTERELFQHITGNDMDEMKKQSLVAQEEFEKNKEMLTFGLDSKPYAFDYHFKKNLKEAKTPPKNRKSPKSPRRKSGSNTSDPTTETCKRDILEKDSEPPV